MLLVRVPAPLKPLASSAVGAVTGYVILALAVLWVRGACLPVSAGEFKWQCAAVPWAIVAGYLAATFASTFIARRRRILVGLGAFLVLFAGHGFAPDLAIISFRRGWFLNWQTLLFAVLPGVLGVTAALLARRR